VSFNSTPTDGRLHELLNVPVDHIGMSGWTVRQMLRRVDAHHCTDLCGRTWPGLRASLRAATTAGDPFSHVIILAGTNDIASERGAREGTKHRATMLLEVFQPRCSHPPSVTTPFRRSCCSGQHLPRASHHPTDTTCRAAGRHEHDAISS
jgi:hypothetical protein